jgi:photosystem II stability/assembly factor-like uncharacterized protein
MGQGGIHSDGAAARKKAVPLTYYDAITWAVTTETICGGAPVYAVAQIGSRVYFFGAGGAVSYTTDGITFTAQDIGAPPSLFLFAVAVNGDVAVVCSSSNVSYRTTDGGVTWSEISPTGQPEPAYGIANDAASAWVIVGFRGDWCISADAGATYAAGVPGLGAPLNLEAATHDGTNFILAGGLSYYYSSDGASWTAEGVAELLKSLCVAASSRVLSGDAGGDVHYSDDHGANWAASGETQFGDNDVLGIGYNSDNGVVAIGGVGGCLNRSTDNGATFGGSLVTSGLSGAIRAVVCTDIGWFAAGDFDAVASANVTISTSKS